MKGVHDASQRLQNPEESAHWKVPHRTGPQSPSECPTPLLIWAVLCLQNIQDLQAMHRNAHIIKTPEQVYSISNTLAAIPKAPWGVIHSQGNSSDDQCILHH